MCFISYRTLIITPRTLPASKLHYKIAIKAQHKRHKEVLVSKQLLKSCTCVDINFFCIYQVIYGSFAQSMQNGSFAQSIQNGSFAQW